MRRRKNRRWAATKPGQLIKEEARQLFNHYAPIEVLGESELDLIHTLNADTNMAALQGYTIEKKWGQVYPLPLKDG